MMRSVRFRAMTDARMFLLGITHENETLEAMWETRHAHHHYNIGSNFCYCLFCVKYIKEQNYEKIRYSVLQ